MDFLKAYAQEMVLPEPQVLPIPCAQEAEEAMQELTEVQTESLESG